MSAWMVLARSLADMPVVHPWPVKSTDTVNGYESCVVGSTIKPKSNSSQRDSSRGAQISLPTMGGHEVDDFGRGVFCRDEKVPFIFSVLVVHDDDDFSASNGLDGFRNRVRSSTCDAKVMR